MTKSPPKTEVAKESSEGRVRRRPRQALTGKEGVERDDDDEERGIGHVGRVPRNRRRRRPSSSDDPCHRAASRSLIVMRLLRTVTVTVPLPLAPLLLGASVRLLHTFALSKYAWVHRRCARSWVEPFDVQSGVECAEASSHMDAAEDPSLWSPAIEKHFYAKLKEPNEDASTPTRRRTAEGGKGGRTAAVNIVKDVHFVLNFAVDDLNARTVALCALESAARMCSLNLHSTEDDETDGKGGGEAAERGAGCRINLWVVGDAATSLRRSKSIDLNTDANTEALVGEIGKGINLLSTPVSDFLRDVESLLQSSAPSTPLCIRATAGGADAVPYRSIDRATTCPPPSSHSLVVGGHFHHPSERLRSWLASSLGRNQKPTHVSNAWRLAALAEYGGLYLDLDLVMLNQSVLTQIFSPAVAAQPKVGAYRLNNALLRFDAIVGSDDGDEVTQQTFLESLVDDQLRWAPELASLPIDKQTFGFLGPASVTRVYHFFSPSSSLSWFQQWWKWFRGGKTLRRETVTVLPDVVSEPPIDGRLCDLYGDGRSWAVHLSGERKKRFGSLLRKYSCLDRVFNNVCPVAMSLR